jgi:hypothetical protein
MTWVMEVWWELRKHAPPNPMEWARANEAQAPGPTACFVDQSMPSEQNPLDLYCGKLTQQGMVSRPWVTATSFVRALRDRPLRGI